MAISFPYIDEKVLADPDDDVTWDFNKRSGETAGHDNIGALWLGSVTVGGLLDDDTPGVDTKSYTFGTSSDDGWSRNTRAT